MANDLTYTLNKKGHGLFQETEHRYSPNVHLLYHPVAQTLLAKFCRPETKLPLLNDLTEKLYEILLDAAIGQLFPVETISWDTRMKKARAQGVLNGDIIKQSQKAIVVDLARAGTFPAHTCFHHLNSLVEPEGLRQDHFYLNRKVNEQQEVVGVDVSGSKIGGGQDDAIVFFPDPMGATGGSLAHCVEHYKTKVPGKAQAYVSLHLIITPEFIQKISKLHPDVHIFALRLDRGLSPLHVLKSVPGTYAQEEKGLDSNQYIVPGAGGVGEILNNSFV